MQADPRAAHTQRLKGGLPGWRVLALIAAAVSALAALPLGTGACFSALQPQAHHKGPFAGLGHRHGAAARPLERAGGVAAGAVGEGTDERVDTRRRWPLAAAAVAGCVAGLRRLAGHRLRQPAKRSQSPMAEITFVLAVYGAVRAAVTSYFRATENWTLREDLFQEMAVVRTYQNSVGPWITSGLIAVTFSILVVVGIKAFIKSMKEWEQRKEIEEMNAMGTEDALFLMSTPVDATPLEKKKERMRKRLTPLHQRILGNVMDKLWLLRVGACVGYLLPLLNVLDFGEISVSLYPYAMGVPPSEPIVNFMQTKLKMKYLYQAYLKSGYYFLIVWFVFIQLAVRNKAAPFFVRFHSSQAILISMLLGVPQQVFFAVLNPWESGLMVQKFMYHSMNSIFLFILVLVLWCCANALLKRTMKMPLVSEAAVMWAGKE